MNPANGLDIVGDVHGQLDALTALGRHLGYRVDGDWSHPDGRSLIFLGDLTDRGPDSLGVVQLALRLEQSGRALWMMGNHEYNLVGWSLGIEKPKASNKPTIADIEARRDAWQPALDRMRTLPMALTFPGLRLIHAMWHLPAFEKIQRLLAPATPSHIALSSPFGEYGFKHGIDDEDFQDQHESPQGILLKGSEGPAPEPFQDSDGKRRDRERVCWWSKDDQLVPRELTVFGHYWNVPPISATHDLFAPPHPSGTPALARWQEAMAPQVAPLGLQPVPANVCFVCVDYNGVVDGGGGSCVGAFRWPEREIAWVRLAGGGLGRRSRHD